MARTKLEKTKNTQNKSRSSKSESDIPSENQDILMIESRQSIIEIDSNISDDQYSKILQEIEAEDYSPNWEILIDGFEVINSLEIKFSVFTPGESSIAQLVTKNVCEPNLNKNLLKWIASPLERNLEVVIRDHDSNLIEKWKAKATPVALALEDLNQDNPSPWCNVLQLSLKDIVIV